MKQHQEKKPHEQDRNNPKPAPQGSQAVIHNDLDEIDVPDSSSEPSGLPGSGQKQDKP